MRDGQAGLPAARQPLDLIAKRGRAMTARSTDTPMMI